MLITLYRRPAICKSDAIMNLVVMAPLGPLSYRFLNLDL